MKNLVFMQHRNEKIETLKSLGAEQKRKVQNAQFVRSTGDQAMERRKCPWHRKPKKWNVENARNTGNEKTKRRKQPRVLGLKLRE